MQKTINRLMALGDMIQRHALSWGQEPPRRLVRWVDEYDNLKRNNPAAWTAYCEKVNADPSHNGHDCLA
jgi:hypothetical protein